jgi:hypothetical protein
MASIAEKSEELKSTVADACRWINPRSNHTLHTRPNGFCIRAKKQNPVDNEMLFAAQGTW